MTQDITQTLLQTRTETEPDIPEWADRLSSAGLLTQREAEGLLAVFVSNRSVEDIAGEEVTASRLYNAKASALQKLRDADQTLAVVNQLRREIEPDPTEE